MILTLEAIFGLLAVTIMLFPVGLHALRWLRRRCCYRNGSIVVFKPRLQFPTLAGRPPSTHQYTFYDVESQIRYDYSRQLCGRVGL